MLPRRFLSDDLGIAFAQLAADQAEIRRRMLIASKQIEALRKTLAALRKRTDRMREQQRRLAPVARSGD